MNHHQQQQQQQTIITPISTTAHATTATATNHLVTPISIAHPTSDPAVITDNLTPLTKVRLSDLIPYDGAPTECYVKAVEALSGSFTRHNAAVIELGSDDGALMRCGLESARLYFRTRAQNGGNSVYKYRAGRYVLFFYEFVYIL